MDQLVDSRENHRIYPRNLGDSNTSSLRKIAYFERLNSEENRLFDAKHPQVEFLDYGKEHVHKEVFTSATKLDEVEGLCGNQTSEPYCRFIFIHAPHGRAALKITRPMLTLLLSYHQVPPSFLDFIFSFGTQERGWHFYLSGLREANRVDTVPGGLDIPVPERSGLDIRLHYNLRSAEPSSSNKSRPWSIRQTAVYHSFDFKTGRTLWINVKGNKLMKGRGLATKKANDGLSCAAGQSFVTSLDAHVMFAEWAGENWYRYINGLESELHEVSDILLTSKTIKGLWKYPFRLNSPGMFTFGDFQKLAYVEETLQEARFVSEINKKVLEGLRNVYEAVSRRPEFPPDILERYRSNLLRFIGRIKEIEEDFEMQDVKTNNLLQMAAQRKELGRIALDHSGISVLLSIDLIITTVLNMLMPCLAVIGAYLLFGVLVAFTR